LKRSEPLRADPAKTQAWKDRSREKAAQNARQKPRKPLARSTPRASRAAGPAVRFRAKRPARTRVCVRCAAEGRRRRASVHHHWLPQSQIRAYVRSLRMRDEDAERKLLKRLLDDERNTSPFCNAHHGSHGTTAHEFTADEVPPSAREFARELGPEWAERLRRMYPARAAL
jgi:hypothetical protein